MTQNESDGEGKITAQNCSLRNKGQPVILRKKTAVPITVTGCPGFNILQRTGRTYGRFLFQRKSKLPVV